MRTQTEIQLLTLRQRHLDELMLLNSTKVVDLVAFRRAYISYKSCDQVLKHYRLKQKFLDVA